MDFPQRQVVKNQLENIAQTLQETAIECYVIAFERDKFKEAHSELVIKLDKFRQKNTELLEALKEMVNSYELEASPKNPALLQAKAIIAKAEGN